MRRLLKTFGPPSREDLDSPSPDASEFAFWRLVIFCRHMAIIAFGVAAVVVPAVGSSRFWLAAAMFGLVLPYNLGLDMWLRRKRRLPPVMAFTDLVIAAVFPLASTEIWTVALMVGVADLALASAAFRRRVTMLAAIAGTAFFGLTGGLTLDGGEATIGVAGFAIASLMAVTAVSTIASGERQLRRQLSDLIGDLDVIVWEARPRASTYSYLSDVAQLITGYPMVNLGHVAFWFDHIHPDDRDRVWQQRFEAIETARTHEDEYRMTTASGETVWLHDVMRIERDADGQATRYRGVTIDITDRKAAEEQVELYADIVERIQMALLVVQASPDGTSVNLLAANPEAVRIVGSHRAERLGRPIGEVIPALTADVQKRLLELTKGGTAFDIERLEGMATDRHKVHSLHAFPLPGRAVGICLDDITGSAMATAALRRQALHDGLTGLPNRTLLRDRLQHALSEARRNQERVALMLMDLDHFKEVNDALGHQYGDRLLTEFANRLRNLLRECDTIARLGGDEFALLLTTNATSEGASRVVAKVRAALEEPFEIDGVTIQTNASIGVALFPDHAETAESLTQRADVAMYTAKRGGGGWAVYSPDHDRSSVERLTLLTELRKAIEQNELSLHYQPVIDVKTRQVVSTEALIRWQHPSYGMLDPGLVIELAELSGLILPLTRWVAQEAVARLVCWLAEGLDLTVAINLSVRNLYDRKLVRWLAELLEQSGVPPERLKVELTESEVMDDPVLAIDVLGALQAIGVTTSIDDFGTGYSSLSYLRRLPVAEIKIDQSFVAGMQTAEHDYTIVRTVIDLAHNLGLSVLAEGVEDPDTLRTLQELGCDRAQGYLMGKPVPADELTETIRQWHDDVSRLEDHR